MGLQAKLLRSYIKGCNDSWDLLDNAVKEVPGIGPKTLEKIHNALTAMAIKEVQSMEETMRKAEVTKLYSAIDDIGRRSVDNGLK